MRAVHLSGLALEQIVTKKRRREKLNKKPLYYFYLNPCQRTEQRLEIGISAVPGFLPKAEIRKTIMSQESQSVLFKLFRIIFYILIRWIDNKNIFVY